MSDKLDLIFEEQAQLAKQWGPIENANGFPVKPILDLTIPEDQMVAKSFAWFITEELGEAMNELKNRPWKLMKKPVDIEHFREELVDALHFYVELLIHCGLTAEDVFNEYMKKAQTNQRRIDSGV